MSTAATPHARRHQPGQERLLIGRASGPIQPWLRGIGGLGGLRLLAMDARSTDSGAWHRTRPNLRLTSGGRAIRRGNSL